MTTTPTTSTTAAHIPAGPSATRRPWTGLRIVALVTGAMLALVSASLLTGGIAALAVTQHRDSDGFHAGKPGHFSTETYAVSTPAMTVSAAGLDAAFADAVVGKIRLQVASTDPGASLFVGVGRAADVAAYLQQVNYDKVDELDTGPFRVSYKRHVGGQPATEPGAQRFWVVSDAGTGPRTLTWSITGGDWAVVIMNTDASAGVQADVTAGVTLPILRPIAITMLVVGGVLLPVATVLILATVGNRSRRPQIGSGTS
jgi:hypothetical protein